MPTDICTMGQRFKAVAREHAQRPALYGLSYAELDALSDKVAAHLLRLGAGQGKVVAIHAEKSALIYAAMIAALKIGAPYVALDTSSPMERLDKILQRAQPTLILTDRPFSWNSKVVMLNTLSEDITPIDATVIDSVKPETPSYLMFTSGSTGFPKGVTISHASQLNFCHWAREQFSITDQDKLTAVNPLYFDNSVFDFTAALFNGAELIPVDRETVTQPKLLVERVKDCTVWFSVPSLLIYITTLRALTAQSWPKMRAIVFGGEGFPKAELKKLHTMYGAQAVLWNVYGPTECTCICSAYAISEKDFEAMDRLAPLGYLADKFIGAVMDEHAKPVKTGEVGELFLMGSQVALGYYNDPERSAVSFARVEKEVPCYRTGDLVWQDGQGQYHFAGRKDNQIKHMGYRIELEEIEAALNGISEVAQAAVIYHKTGTHGRIVAFAKADMSADNLKSKLREKLPSYMIPETIELMDALPKNANGKVDRKALAAQYGETHG